MTEGWAENTYWVIFEEPEEALRLTEGYGIAEYLPGHRLVALRNWDDFVVADTEGRHFLIPTVPLEPKQLAAVDFAVEKDALEWDGRLAEKIKWYVKPLVFGGDAEAKDNLAWVTLEQHVEVVRWWAGFYREEFASEG
ncbi:hypothetical protein BH09VER1_BH09VER1_30570 [soil metagenome]